MFFAQTLRKIRTDRKIFVQFMAVARMQIRSEIVAPQRIQSVSSRKNAKRQPELSGCRSVKSCAETPRSGALSHALTACP